MSLTTPLRTEWFNVSGNMKIMATQPMAIDEVVDIKKEFSNM